MVIFGSFTLKFYWVFTYGSNIIGASSNVSSVVDNGTGHWIINFINPLPSANCAVFFSNGNNTTRNDSGNTCVSRTTTSVEVAHFEGNSPKNVNEKYICVYA